MSEIRSDAPSLRGPSSAVTEADAPAWLCEEASTGNPDCDSPDCGLYPHYGVAPHECFYKRGPEFKIGQSLGLPPEQWPDNLVLDVEPGEDPATITYPNACGVYYCPSCKAGMPQDSRKDGASPKALSTQGPQS